MNYLEKAGYKCWENKNEKFKNVDINTLYWSRRVDFEYTDLPVCELNDKLFVNIIETKTSINKEVFITYEVELNGEVTDTWVHFKIYSIKDTEFEKVGVKKWERRVVELWRHYHNNILNNS